MSDIERDEELDDILNELVLTVGRQVTDAYKSKHGLWEGMSIENVKAKNLAVERIASWCDYQTPGSEAERLAFNRGLIWATEYLTNRHHNAQPTGEELPL